MSKGAAKLLLSNGLSQQKYQVSDLARELELHY
jgi:hypothetical protein